MNYSYFFNFNEMMNFDKAKEMNKRDKKRYFRKVERKIKKENSIQESNMNKFYAFQLDQVKELEKMKDDFNVDEFKQIIYKDSSENTDVSNETLLFYNLFENTVRNGYNFVCYAIKNWKHFSKLKNV